MSTVRNQVKLIGKVSFDPEVREIAKGRLVARLTLVEPKDGYTSEFGERVSYGTNHTVVAWGTMANDVHAKVKKGASLAIEGRLVHRSYTGKDGQKRYVTEVIMSSFTLLPSA